MAASKQAHSQRRCSLIATVTIVNQKLRWQSIASAALHYFLGYPLCCRKWRYRNVQDFPIHVPDYEKDIEATYVLLGEQTCAEICIRNFSHDQSIFDLSATLLL